MGKYLIQFKLTKEGVQGLLTDGGAKRRQAIEEGFKHLGRHSGGRLLLLR